ncbi:MAG: hypothetical protein O3B41_01015 [Bacteroidetes bacterium]|nr:hypothetical protein [Bacteroidota bacterium]
MSFYILHFDPFHANKWRYGSFLTVLLIGAMVGCVSVAPTAQNQITVEGRAVVMGNVPFAKLILETSDRNSYILEMSREMRDSLMTPAQIRVTGSLSVGAWNGRPFAQIQVSDLKHVH